MYVINGLWYDVTLTFDIVRKKLTLVQAYFSYNFLLLCLHNPGIFILFFCLLYSLLKFPFQT